MESADAASAAGPTAVDAFEDGLVPFLGDPSRSKVAGKVVQVTAGLLALYSLARAGLWFWFASLAKDPLGATVPLAKLDQLQSVGHLLDGIDWFFWPTFILALVTDFVWRRQRRPKDLLQAQGEAYVEATIRRAVPRQIQVLSLVFFLGGFVIGTTSAPSKNLRPSQISGYATTRGVASFAFMLGWVMLIVLVHASEAHLAKRMQKTVDPRYAGWSVPFVAPEKERSAFESSTAATPSEPEGLLWWLRTAGLIFAAMVSGIAIIASVATIGTSPVVSGLWLLGSGAVFGLVVWAFVRRYRRNHPRSNPAG